MQPFPFPELHSDSHPGSSRHEALQEGQLAGLPNLDWLSETSASDARGRPGGNSPSAARQPSGALIDSIGDPAELLSQPNAPFLLSFLSSREDDSRQASRKATTPGECPITVARACTAGCAVLHVCHGAVWSPCEGDVSHKQSALLWSSLFSESAASFCANPCEGQIHVQAPLAASRRQQLRASSRRCAISGHQALMWVPLHPPPALPELSFVGVPLLAPSRLP